MTSFKKISSLQKSFVLFNYSTAVAGGSSNRTFLAKKKAAFQAVDDYIKDGTRLGVGSGSTMDLMVERLSQIVKQTNIKIVCIPTSFQAQQQIIQNNLFLGTLETYPELDVTIDGADEVDENFVVIKGGGGCQTQEKIVASCSKKLIIVIDYTKNSKNLGDSFKGGIPVEVVPIAHVPISKRITHQFGGTTSLRISKLKMGPIITDNGNFIVDWAFPGNIKDWATLNRAITMIPGVVETGIFADMVDTIYLGEEDGSVTIKNKKI